jgi:hypothetical protein
MKDPRVDEFEQLIRCTCCERHKKNRPTTLGVLQQHYPTQTNIDEDECQCTCRQRSRTICRDLCGCYWIGPEPAEIQELPMN